MELLEKRLGKKIADRRNKLGWTQEFLAQQLDVETETISRMERGVTIPSLKTLEKLATIIDMTLSELFSNELTKGNNSEMDSLTVLLKKLHHSDLRVMLDTSTALAKHLLTIRKI